MGKKMDISYSMIVVNQRNRYPAFEGRKKVEARAEQVDIAVGHIETRHHDIGPLFHNM